MQVGLKATDKNGLKINLEKKNQMNFVVYKILFKQTFTEIEKNHF